MNENELNFLLDEANVGLYNKCEVIEILGFEKNKTPFNIFTLVVFENTTKDCLNKLFTDKLQKFKKFKNISWGINRRVINIKDAFDFFILLKEKNIFKFDKEINISPLKLLPTQSIQKKDSFNSPQINAILKNNFNHGSYLVEFFDESKEYCDFLIEDENLLKEFSSKLLQFLPINLETLSDRLGNVIFQLPRNDINIDFETIKNTITNRYSGIKIFIDSQKTENFLIRVYEEIDGNISVQKIVNEVKKETIIPLDDCFGTTIEVFDKNTSLLVYKNNFNIIKNFSVSMHSSGVSKRNFKIDNNPIEVPISGKNEKKIQHNKDYLSWIGDRNSKNELKNLEENKSFQQYFGKEGDDKKALDVVRTLINKYGSNGVYLWDPYLSADDVKNTLYYSKDANIPLKAITALKQNSSRIKNVFRNMQFNITKNILKYVYIDYQYTLICFLNLTKNEKVKKDMIDTFNIDKVDKEDLYLDFEIRSRIGNNGYDFHDRFLIFPLDSPKVWSLGISVNQLGKSHHILQEVKHATHILNAFNNLWDELEKEECIVWKSK